MSLRENPDGTITLTENARKVFKERIAAAVSWSDLRAKLEENQEDSERSFTTEAERNLSLVRGNYWAKRGKRKIRQINHIGPAVKVKHQIITAGETFFILTARKKDFVEIQDVAQPTLNDAWDALGFDHETDAALFDSFIYKQGGVVEVGWRYKEYDTADTSEVDDVSGGDSDAPVPDMMADGSTLPSADQQPSPPEPVIDDPFVERFKPSDFLVDPACTTYLLTDARYVFRKKKEYLERIKANPRYKNTKDLKGTEDDRLQDNEKSKDKAVEMDVRRVNLFDGYVWYAGSDKVETLYHVVMAEDSDKELLCEKTPYDHFTKPGFRNAFPFEVVPATVVDNDSIDGVADVSQVRDLQVSHDESYTQVEYQRAHSPNTYEISEDAIEGESGQALKKRLESGIENTVVGKSPDTLGKGGWMQRAPIHEDAYKSLAETPAKIRDQIGVSEFQTNMLPSKQMTATEANQLASQGGTRQDADIEAYRFFLSRVGYKVLTLLQQFTESRQYSYQTPDGKTEYGTATPDKLLGVKGDSYHEPGIQFKVDLDASRKAPKNEALEKQQAIELLAGLKDFAAMPDPQMPNRPMVNIPALLRGLLDKYHLANADDIVPPAPTPEETEQAKAEVEKQQQQAAQSGQQGPKGPSEAMAFNDLPMNGKIQMAAQVGIQLTPDDFLQQAAILQEEKAAEVHHGLTVADQKHQQQVQLQQGAQAHQVATQTQAEQASAESQATAQEAQAAQAQNQGAQQNGEV